MAGKFSRITTDARKGPALSSARSVSQTNDFLIVKQDSENQSFAYGQVTSVNGGSVEVKLADGKTRTVKQGDFYSLTKSETPAPCSEGAGLVCARIQLGIPQPDGFGFVLSIGGLK